MRVKKTILENCTLIPLPSTHEEWIEDRKKGLGGSDAGTVIGINKWSSPFSLWLQKTGRSEAELEMNEILREGHDFENYVAQRFCEETGKKVCRSGFSFQSKGYPFMRANVDRLIIGEDAGLECKTTSPMNEQELKEGKINPSYYAQCQHYMAVTGLPVWYIAILCFQRGFYVFRIERNEEDIAALIESEQEFWNENVLKDIPPATDGSYSTTSSLNHLLSMYGNMLDQPVDLDDMTEDLDEYEMLTEMLESLNTRKDEITNRFKIRLADAETGYCKQRKITFKPQTSKRIDSKTLRKEMPEIAEKYTKESKPVRVLRIK